jgi:hypothetical protein
MYALMRRSRGPRGARAFGLGLAGPAVLLLACLDVNAAAIHRHNSELSALHSAGIPASELPVFEEWSRYLLAGPTTWAKVEHPPWTQAVQKAVWQSIKTDPGPTDPMINFLLWKQAIDPPRFAHYHPTLAPALHRIAMTRSKALVPQEGPTTTSTGSVGGTPTTASTPTTSPTTSPQNLVPPSVPEPSMLLLAAGMMAWFVRRVRVRPRVRDE